MSNVNVNRSLSDQFYRYKMPKLLAKVEGKGNGIKTVVVNMVEVAKALNRPPTYPTKYFGCELGAQTQFDWKNERYIVNGSHDAAKLQDLLDGFIKRYVLCPSCDNPETVLTVLPKKGVINTKCIACGYSGQLDSTHKLTTFILKNPPGQDPTKTSSSTTKKSKKKGGKDEKTPRKQQNGDDSGSHSPQHDSDDLENGSPEKDDDDWCDDTDAEAVARRMESLTSGAKGLMLNDDLEKSPQERLDLFYVFVKKHKETGNIENLHKEVVGEAERLDIKDKAVLVLCELLLGENILPEVKTHRLLFLRFTAGNHKAQKYLLGGLEQVIKLHKDALINKVPHILKAFYDTDILEEEVLIDWSQKVSKKYVSKEVAQEIHDKAKPFIKWLQEAEEEESSDEEEEEEVEVVYSDRHISTSISVEKETPKPAKPAAPVDNDEDDLDIDAI
ncbi:Eukaryotic translation initiation factor 5 [Araneus ventricosus]|uniref:Eukaryotic translation initiation factor 5 n=1 Tax=Araneus ventricosus TaxID=182803 RepID=A0A4Y2PNL8_ARAVE|nr:Eukaryotic translation initiation factor 5 [Araneus ventricosus]GBN52320.1 Eukaryotic translation initiation factor 5 [Araneus ventricosus]GBN52739.1 Eukaryotic translation initiation factor 5 [Araneus ventricosus]GBN54282.1 Eukaryotic translation initiation factor 5 [Araneus ventricosus]